MSEQQEKDRSMNVSYTEPSLPRVSLIIWIVGIGFLIFCIWAWIFKLEEVSTGVGKVIPSSKEQVIQSLEGGILTKLNVQEGDIVEKGEILAQLDPTRFASNVGESQSLLVAAQATAARLRAEVNGTPLVFPKIVTTDSMLVSEETALYQSRREDVEQTLKGYKEALQLVQQELTMTEPLVAKGAASEVEVLRLRRSANDLQNKMNDVRNQYYVKAREELAKANMDIQTQQQVVVGRTDSLDRAIFRAPVRGVVKEISVTTHGGVIPQNGKFMTIVPIDEKLLIEARILPRDIAFIHPGQEALVKITAYDYSIYGGLKGKVTVIIS